MSGIPASFILVFRRKFAVIGMGRGFEVLWGRQRHKVDL